jgi:hypothetical protein
MFRFESENLTNWPPTLGFPVEGGKLFCPHLVPAHLETRFLSIKKHIFYTLMVKYLPDLCKLYDVINGFWLVPAFWVINAFLAKISETFNKSHISIFPHIALTRLLQLSRKFNIFL